MPDIFFADISNFQDSADLPTYRKTNAVVICQINWGTSVTVPAGRVAEIRALKFAVVVWYIGLVTTEDIGAQVAVFLRTIGPLQPGEAVCIDWESTPGEGTPTAAQRDEAANLIAQGRAIPVAMVGVYGSPGNLDASPPLGWGWVAAYEEPEPGTPHIFWQFTNGQYTSGPYAPVNFPGIGFVDGSVYHGTVDQLAALIVPGAPAPPQPPQPKDDPMLGISPMVKTSDGAWHRASIVFNGLCHSWTYDGKTWSQENVAKESDPSGGPISALTFDANQVPTCQVVENDPIPGAAIPPVPLVNPPPPVDTTPTSLVIGAQQASGGKAFDFIQTTGTPGWGAREVV